MCSWKPPIHLTYSHNNINWGVTGRRASPRHFQPSGDCNTKNGSGCWSQRWSRLGGRRALTGSTPPAQAAWAWDSRKLSCSKGKRKMLPITACFQGRFWELRGAGASHLRANASVRPGHRRHSANTPTPSDLRPTQNPSSVLR